MQTLQNLVDSLSRRLHCAVSLDDRPLQMMFHSCLYGRLDEARIRRMPSPDRGPEPAVTQYIRGCVREAAPISSPLRIPPNPDLGVESRLFMPIRVENELLGTLLVFDPEYSLGEDEIPVIKRAANTAAQIIRYERILWDPDRGREHDLLSAILFGSAETSVRGAMEAHRTGLLEPGPVVVLVAALPGGSTSLAQLTEVAEDMRGLFAPGHALLAESAGEVDVLVSTAEPGIQREGISTVARRMGSLILEGLRVGIGEQRSEARAAQESLHEAQQALSLAGQGPFPTVLSWSQLGAMRLLLQVTPAWLKENPLVPGLLELMASQPAFVETLEAYLRNAGHVQKTAAELFIHRATLHYRLRRIEEICGLDLDSGDDRLALHLALKAAFVLRASS